MRILIGAAAAAGGRPARRCAWNGRQGRPDARIRSSAGTASSRPAAASATSPCPGAARRRSPPCASSDGRVLRFATVRGRARRSRRSTWDGTTDGLSADGRRLVLASITSRAARRHARRSSSCGANTLRSSAPDRAAGPLGVRRDLPRRLDDLRASSTRDLSHYSVRAIDTVSGRVCRGADRRQARARRGDARLADDARVGTRPQRGPTRSTRSRTARPSSTPSTRRAARRSASICPGRASATGSAGCGSRSARDGRSLVPAPAGRRHARHDRPRQPSRSGACSRLRLRRQG